MSFIFKCPVCNLQMECPDALDGTPCECPGCRQTVMPRRKPLNFAQAEPSSGVLSAVIKFFAVTASIAVLAAGGWWGYKNIYLPSRALQNQKNMQEFQQQFSLNLSPSAGTVQTWKNAALDSGGRRFLADCMINRNGQSGQIRIFGQKLSSGEYSYISRTIESADDFSSRTFASMLAEEKIIWNELQKEYSGKINAVKSQALQNIQDLADGLTGAEYYTPANVRERFIEIRNAVRQDPRYIFGSALFGRFREFDNLDETAAEITNQENNAVDTYMANTAIQVYESQHGSLPESSRVDNYTAKVKALAKKITFLCGKHREISGNIKKISPDGNVTPTERVDIEELKEKLIPLERNIYDSYSDMLAGIKCGSRRCGKCRDFRLPAEHVKLIFNKYSAEAAVQSHTRLEEIAKLVGAVRKKEEDARQAEAKRKAREARKEARRKEEERKAAERDARMQKAIDSYQSNVTYQVKEKCSHSHSCRTCRSYISCDYHGCSWERTKKFFWRGFDKYYYYTDNPDRIYKAD